jgi:hypothetical protein
MAKAPPHVANSDQRRAPRREDHALTLQARGYTIVGDTARTIIQGRRGSGLSPRPDPYAFAQEALRMDID